MIVVMYNLVIIWLSNILALSVPKKDYYRNAKFDIYVFYKKKLKNDNVLTTYLHYFFKNVNRNTGILLDSFVMMFSDFMSQDVLTQLSSPIYQLDQKKYSCLSCNPIKPTLL
jgi:hypothetical protein